MIEANEEVKEKIILTHGSFGYLESSSSDKRTKKMEELRKITEKLENLHI